MVDPNNTSHLRPSAVPFTPMEKGANQASAAQGEPAPTIIPSTPSHHRPTLTNSLTAYDLGLGTMATPTSKMATPVNMANIAAMFGRSDRKREVEGRVRQQELIEELKQLDSNLVKKMDEQETAADRRHQETRQGQTDILRQNEAITTALNSMTAQSQDALDEIKAAHQREIDLKDHAHERELASKERELKEHKLRLEAMQAELLKKSKEQAADKDMQQQHNKAMLDAHRQSSKATAQLAKDFRDSKEGKLAVSLDRHKEKLEQERRAREDAEADFHVLKSQLKMAAAERNRGNRKLVGGRDVKGEKTAAMPNEGGIESALDTERKAEGLGLPSMVGVENTVSIPVPPSTAPKGKDTKKSQLLLASRDINARNQHSNRIRKARQDEIAGEMAAGSLPPPPPSTRINQVRRSARNKKKLPSAPPQTAPI